MEVHHHTHTERKKFTHYLWEFFMLFLAVTLGFIVENMRENSAERKKAGEYALLLKVDLVNDTISLEHFIRKKDTELIKMNYGKKILSKSEEEITIGDLRNLNDKSFSLDQFMPHDATLNQLNTSGALRYFKDPYLKNHLANYQWSIKNFSDLFNKITSGGGGIQSEHLLEYDIHINKFLKKCAGLDSGILAKKARYDFESWDENNNIRISLMEAMEFLYDIAYPQLKEQATEIIKLLTNEYHLK
jgi:hypothetical protein